MNAVRNRATRGCPEIQAEPGAVHGHKPSPAAAVTVMIASEQQTMNASWSRMLAREPGIEIRNDRGMDATCLATCVEHHLPEVLLLDKALLDGLDPQSLQRIRGKCRHVRVLLLWHEISRCLLADMLRNRFNGFLLTTCLPETSLKAIRAVSRGEAWMSHEALAIASTDLTEPAGLPPVEAGVSADAILADASQGLTPRESQVVALVCRGCINKEIARELAITEGTVKKHLQSVFAKLGVHRRTLVALRPFQNGATHSDSRINDADARQRRHEGFVPSFVTAHLHDRPLA